MKTMTNKDIKALSKAIVDNTGYPPDKKTLYEAVQKIRASTENNIETIVNVHDFNIAVFHDEGVLRFESLATYGKLKAKEAKKNASHWAAYSSSDDNGNAATKYDMKTLLKVMKDYSKENPANTVWFNELGNLDYE